MGKTLCVLDGTTINAHGRKFRFLIIVETGSHDEVLLGERRENSRCQANSVLMVPTTIWQPVHGGLSGARMRTLGVIAVLGVMFAACALSQSQWQFQRDLLAVDRMADYGEYQDAYDAYGELAERAPANVDLHYLRYRRAYMLEQMERWQEALDSYEEIYRNPTHPYDDYAARSLYRSANIVGEELGDPQLGRELLIATIRTFPNTNFADDALYDLHRELREREAWGELVALVSGLYPELKTTEIADNLVYIAATTLQDELEDYEAARELYDILITRFQRSSLVDDAIWRTAESYRQQGDIDTEYRLLTEFIEGRELSIILADYDYSYYNPAYMRLAEIHEDRGELREAIGMYRRFQTTFPLSLEADDIQFHIIELYQELGEVEKMEEFARELAEEWPESRWIDDAEELIREAGGQL